MSSSLTSYRKSQSLTLETLGSRLGVGAAAICKWERKRVPAERVLDVERITGISRHDLRPDLYPLERAS